MLSALDRGEKLRTEYPAPVAVWQFGDDLTLVGIKRRGVPLAKPRRTSS